MKNYVVFPNLISPPKPVESYGGTLSLNLSPLSVALGRDKKGKLWIGTSTTMMKDLSGIDPEEVRHLSPGTVVLITVEEPPEGLGTILDGIQVQGAFELVYKTESQEHKSIETVLVFSQLEI